MTSRSLEGRRVLVTGGSLGIGRAISHELASQGASVTIAARSRGALVDALAELPGEGHASLRLDVAQEAEWFAAARALETAGPLHGVVCSAGILGPIGRIDEVDVNEFINVLSVNLVGTFLTLRHTLGLLEQAGGRAVALSGGGATAPFPRFDGYAASKAAVVRLVENVAETTTVELNCVAPGFVATRMHEQTLESGPERVGPPYYERTKRELQDGGYPASEAAGLVSFLISDAAAGISGRLISAQWDPWRETEFRARLRTDAGLGRVRRIDGQFFGPISSR